MSSPSHKQKTKQQDGQTKSNIERVVGTIFVSRNVPEYEKTLLQMRIFQEKRMFSIAMQLYKKGMRLLIERMKSETNDATKITLQLIRSRYYHYASSINYERQQYLKAISLALAAVNGCKEILDNSSIEMMRFKEVLACSYKELEQYKDALTYFEPMLSGLNVQIKNKRTQHCDDHKMVEDSKQQNETDCSLKELTVWKGNVTYNIAMIYNSQKQFEQASVYAKQCCVVRNFYEPSTEKQLLALLLVSVIVSCPRIAEYKLALDSLEKAKQIIQANPSNQQLKHHLSRVDKLLMTILNECVRWSKMTNLDLTHYLATGERRNTKQ